jgi:predicted GH43/DUF377 family glycosyl hydrolase
MIGKFKDYNHNPILWPTKGFESKRVYNPAVIIVNNIFYMFYRAESGDDCTGRIGMAESKDGIHFKRFKRNPIIFPEYDYEKRGCEDPRIVKIENTFWLTYVGNSKDGANICLASSKDLIHWKKHGPVIDPKKYGRAQVKAGVIVPEKIQDRYLMYFTQEKKAWKTGIAIAYSENLLDWYEKSKDYKHILWPRRGNFFDNYGVECGTNPVLLKEGIFMVYSGWQKNHFYQPGGVLFSKKNPTKILERSREPILKTKKDWGKEFEGWEKPHIVAQALVKNKNIWYLYYGAGDVVVSLAFCPENKLLI